jgi:peptidoglycan pentaglycine glycine transferase (the first glycine)
MHLHRAGAAYPRGRGVLTLRAAQANPEEVRRWDDLAAATGRHHLLQSAGWAQLKSTTGWVARRYVLRSGPGTPAGLAQVLLRRLPLGLSFAYAPRGPLVGPEALAEAVAALRAALGPERCVALLCDPEIEDEPAVRERLRSARVRPAPVYVQPRRTLLMRLDREPDELLAAMRKKTRQYIRKAERAGVATEETDDVDRFLAVLRKVAARDRFGIHDRAYFVRLLGAFPRAVHLQMARLDDLDVGALLVVRLGDRAWELYGGWSGDRPEERPFYLLKWRSLLRMRQLGVRRYDMWGLAEGNEADALAGVEQFKLGFGGDVVTWVGALESPVQPALFPLWRLAGRRRLARAAS